MPFSTTKSFETTSSEAACITKSKRRSLYPAVGGGRAFLASSTSALYSMGPVRPSRSSNMSCTFPFRLAGSLTGLGGRGVEALFSFCALRARRSERAGDSRCSLQLISLKSPCLSGSGDRSVVVTSKGAPQVVQTPNHTYKKMSLPSFVLYGNSWENWKVRPLEVVREVGGVMSYSFLHIGSVHMVTHKLLKWEGDFEVKKGRKKEEKSYQFFHITGLKMDHQLPFQFAGGGTVSSPPKTGTGGVAKSGGSK